MTGKIEIFFSSAAFGVIGASADRSKYGNKVLRCYLANKKKVYPVNPHERSIEGESCIADLADLPQEVRSISIITPPKITEQIVDKAIKHGITNVWMQPGAESELAITKCEQHGVNVISGGPCILVHFKWGY